jgi:L-ascorbate metabolism protein UlaG (beta-lactamase superfamily)
MPETRDFVVHTDHALASRRIFTKMLFGVTATAAIGAIQPLSLLASPPSQIHLPLPPLSVSSSSVSNSAITACSADTSVSIQWIGHSTMLISVGGKTILTDPVLFEKIGLRILGATVGPRRMTKPAYSINNLPKPDVILLSHAHIDHTDLSTLEFLAEKFPGEIDVITARNTLDVSGHLLWRSMQELDWGMAVEFGSIRIEAFEVLHNGWRLPWEPDRREGRKKTGRSYNGYIIQVGSTRLAFAGDTAYTEAFKQLNDIDVAMMPIGAYTGCADNHCTPEEALAMADMMNAKAFMPMHCNTFALTQEAMNEPMQRLWKARHQYKTKIVTHRIGQTYSMYPKNVLAHEE